MPPPIPSRYRLEIRLGRNEDIEEWFATDLELDRPVLIRLVGPEASPARGKDFLTAVRQASRVSHTHVAAVFAADHAQGSYYAVTEWVGGTTLSDQQNGGRHLNPSELLSNAAGLTDGLAALHAEKIVHGAIDADAILYTQGQTAKLGGFGQRVRNDSSKEDVRSLAETLESAFIRKPSGLVAPTELIDRLPPLVDDALRSAQTGGLDAQGLANRLSKASYPSPVSGSFDWSWRSVLPVGLVGVLAAVLIWMGTVVDTSTSPSIQVSALPLPNVLPGPEPDIELTPALEEPIPSVEEESGPAEPVMVEEVIDFDPLGDDGENPHLLGFIFDGDPNTDWATERYFERLSPLKEGVGLAFEITGTPSLLELVGLSEGTAFRLMWAESLVEIDSPDWEVVAEEVSGAGTLRIPLPPFRDGVWLLWLTDLPLEGDRYRSKLGEAEFHN